MKTLEDIHGALIAPFDVSDVYFKPGALNQEKTEAMVLSYVDARAVQDRLDAAAGPGGWEYHCEVVGTGENRVAVKGSLTILGITREDMGEANGEESERYKAAVSDAFKRAAVQFGIGRFLYSLDSPWMAYDQQRRRFVSPGEVKNRMAQVVGRAAGVGRVVIQASTEHTCGCGQTITHARVGNRNWTADQIVAETTKHFGKPLCVECWREATKERKAA